MRDVIATTTGSSIEVYLDWIKDELEKKGVHKSYGKVTISFNVNKGQVVDVEKTSIDNDHFPLKKEV